MSQPPAPGAATHNPFISPVLTTGLPPLLCFLNLFPLRLLRVPHSGCLYHSGTSGILPLRPFAIISFPQDHLSPCSPQPIHSCYWTPVAWDSPFIYMATQPSVNLSPLASSISTSSFTNSSSLAAVVWFSSITFK